MSGVGMGGAWCQRAPPHPRGHTPARVAPHLCATLPFLMSEMIRGSPRFLLAAVEQGRQAVNLILKALCLRWGRERTLLAPGPIASRLGDCEQISSPLRDSVSLL